MAEVSKVSYHIFYEVLLDKYYNDFKDRVKSNLSKTSPKIWDWELGKTSLVKEVFKSLKANDYFYKRRSLFKMSDPNPGTLMNTPLIEALTYLGYKITKDVDHRHKIPPKDKAEILFGLFEKDYAKEITLLQGNWDIRNKKKLPPDFVDKILRRNEKRSSQLPQSERFFKLNGTFIGRQIQGKHKPEPITFVLRTLDQNNVEGEVIIYYKADGYNDEGEAIYPIAGKFLNDTYLALTYWNVDSSILQNGVIYLKFSGDCRKLEGYFIGVYDPVAQTRASNTFQNEFIQWKEQVSGILLDLEKSEKTRR